MDLWTLLGDIVVLLAASLLVGGMLCRIGQSPLVGYLIADMMLGGPGSFHVVGSEEAIEAIAELGVALLLFSLGLEFSIERLKKLGVRPLIGGVVQVVLTIAIGGLGSAWAAHAAGVSPALGAFVAGMLLGSSVFATQIRADVSSLRVVLLTLFFGAAGMVADPVWILQNWQLVAAATVILTLVKLAVIWAIFQALGHSTRVASATGLCLAQIGEFAFVLGSIGVTSGVVTTEMYALVVSVTIVSFLLSAVLVPAAPRFGNRIALLFGTQSARDDGMPSSSGGPDVVIIGFGPAGEISAQSLIDRDCHVTVIDLNRDGVRRAQQLGFRGAVGDATQSDVLEHAHVEQAEVIVITVPHHHSAMMILEQTRQIAPKAHVVVRSRYKMHSNDYVTAGAHAVVGDEEQVGESLASHLQQWLDQQ